MSTSEYEYRVLTDTNEYGDSPQALDAFTSRIVMSNLNHLADEFAQVRCALSGTVAALSGKAGYLTSRTPTAINTPYAVVSTSFPMLVRGSGASYKLRVRIGGASSNVAAAAIFTAVLSLGRDAPAAVGDASEAPYTDAVYITDATASTAAAWLTGASQGPGGYATLMEMNAAEVEACALDFPTTDAPGGGAVTVRVAWVTLTIFASTSNVTYVPKLFAVYAAEVIGT